MLLSVFFFHAVFYQYRVLSAELAGRLLFVQTVCYRAPSDMFICTALSGLSICHQSSTASCSERPEWRQPDRHQVLTEWRADDEELEADGDDNMVTHLKFIYKANNRTDGFDIQNNNRKKTGE